MKEERIIGNNIQLLLNDKHIEKNIIANALGYSVSDITRICQGRVFLTMNEIEDISSYFDVKVDDLLTAKSDEEYERAGCIHYNHTFKNQANLDMIMDIFDLVCDIEEAL